MSTPDNRSPDPAPPESGQLPKDPGVSPPPPQPELPRWATRHNASTPFSEARMAAYIGPRWESTYRAKLAPFFADPAFVPTWNWAAFTVGPLWFLYRKLYLAFSMFYIASQILSARLLMGVKLEQLSAESLASPEGKPLLMIVLGLQLAVHFAAAGTANWLLFRRARAASLVVSIQQVPEDVAITRLQRVGGTTTLPVVLLLLLSLAFAVAAALAPAA